MNNLITRKDLIYFEIKSIQNSNSNRQLYEIYYNKNLNTGMICISSNNICNKTPEHRYLTRREFRYYSEILYDLNIIEWVGTASDLYTMAKNNTDIKTQINQSIKFDISNKHIKNLYKVIILMYEYDNKMWLVK